MTTFTWTASYVEYDVTDLDPDQYSNSQVKVTNLFWQIMASDGEFYVPTSGSVSVEDQNRVYTLSAIKNVPNHVMVGWVQEALGPQGVADAEAQADAKLTEKKQPSQGGFTPE